MHPADYSFAELQAELRLLLDGTHPVLGDTAVGHAGIDVAANRVVAAPALDGLAAARTAAPDSIHIAPRRERVVHHDVCHNRRNCGHPLRSGIILWQGQYSNPLCSLGFTASATDGSRWAVVAGHCGADRSIWGHGEQRIGPLKARVFTASLDVARIQVQSAYWLQSTRGWIHNYISPNSPLAVDFAIGFESSMIPGEVLCLSAWHSTAATACGILGAVNDPSAAGMARVDNFDACGGDSGGGWYWMSSSGIRWAYGIHSNSSHSGCHVAGGSSWFSTLPDINAFWDRTSAATVRVDYR